MYTRQDNDASKILLLCNHEGYLDWWIVLHILSKRFPEHHIAFVHWNTPMTLFPSTIQRFMNMSHIGMNPFDSFENKIQHLHEKVNRIDVMATKYIIVCFPEGTIHHLDHSSYFDTNRLLLQPKTSGTWTLIKTIRFDCILDMTIYYPETMHPLYKQPLHASFLQMCRSNQYSNLCWYSFSKEEKLGQMTTYQQCRQRLYELWTEKNETLRQWQHESTWINRLLTIQHKDSTRMFLLNVLSIGLLSLLRISETYSYSWYPLSFSKQIPQRRPFAFSFQDIPLIAYRNQTDHITVHSDICPHMGAFLHKGWISSYGTLHCPYHGFEFDNGSFVRIPHYQHVHNTKSCFRKVMTCWPVIEKNGMVWIQQPSSNDQTQKTLIDETCDPYFPPEHNNPEFQCVEGYVDMPRSQQLVTENLLDMLHISYVHSFGNPTSPIPLHVQYEQISPVSGRTLFVYTPHANTISRRIGATTNVVVENEFHLPSTTITRVTAGTLMKTVWTTTLPTGSHSCRLFWRVYRNFWKDPFFPEMNIFGNWLITFLMKQTLLEDKWILSNVQSDRDKWIEHPIRTKYDVTILKYRQAQKQFPSYLK